MVIMSTIDYDGKGQYWKKTFVQTFNFANGNCIKNGGDGNAYYDVAANCPK